jgi:tripartite-type tricarboxylate transporter receptor subunit TctC
MFRPSTGGVKGYEATIWLGMMAPAGTPRPIIEKLNAEIQQGARPADVKETWGKRARGRWAVDEGFEVPARRH